MCFQSLRGFNFRFIPIAVWMISVTGSLAAPVNLPPMVRCPTASAIIKCGSSIEIFANVSDPEGDAMTAVWTVNGMAVQTNTIPASTVPATNTISVFLTPAGGTNIVAVVVTDSAGNDNSCFTPVVVGGGQRPSIVSAKATPDVLWPPNHRLVPVEITADVVTDCGASADWKIVKVTSNEPINGPGHFEPDYVITGDHTLLLRAERHGERVGRVYVILLQAQDSAGNTSIPFNVQVTVPKSQGK